MTDFETWLHDFGYDHILRMLEIRRPGQYIRGSVTIYR